MEEKEFRQKVMPLQQLMYTVALKLGLPPDDAADAVQETQLRLWRNRQGIPENASQFRSYCMTALRNECISQYRRKRETLPLEEAVTSEIEVQIPEAESRDERNFIEKAIDRLPAGQKEVIRLSSFGELDNGEIAEATGLNPANVRQLLSRGRQRLREMIKSMI